MLRTLVLAILALFCSILVQATPVTAATPLAYATPEPFLPRPNISYTLTNQEILACTNEALVLNPHIVDPRRIPLLAKPVEAAIPCGVNGSIVLVAFTKRGQTIWGFAEETLRQRKYQEAVARVAMTTRATTKPVATATQPKHDTQPSEQSVPWRGFIACLGLFIIILTLLHMDMETTYFSDLHRLVASLFKRMRAYITHVHLMQVHSLILHSFAIPLVLLKQRRHRTTRRVIRHPSSYPIELHGETQQDRQHPASPEWRKLHDGYRQEYDQRERSIAEQARANRRPFAQLLKQKVAKDLEAIFHPR